MRKFAFLFIALCACMTVQGQTIEFDDYLDDSIKVYSTSSVICRSLTDKMVLSVSLTKYTFRSSHDYYTIKLTVNTGEHCSIPKDGRVLIKTADDSVIELKSISDAESEIRTDIVSGIAIKTVQLVGNYVISEADLQKMFKGVKKVRMEILPTNYEKDFKKDKIGKALQAEYNLLKDKAFSEQRKSNFSEGF